MKYVAIDIDGVVFGKDRNSYRVYIHHVFSYILEHNIRLILYASQGGSDVAKSASSWFYQVSGKVYAYSIPEDVSPNLVITADPSFKGAPSIVVPYYDKNIHNIYSCIVMVGKLLESIRNRVILNKNEVAIIPQKPEDKPKPPDEGDVTKYGTIIRR